MERQAFVDRLQPWRGGRVVDGSGLENRRAERHRGFESHLLRFAPLLLLAWVSAPARC